MSSNRDRPAEWTTDDWATPRRFVRQLERAFGPFAIDPCCCIRTHKAPTYYSLENDDDGLLLPWNGPTFFNPPYSDPLPWCRRAARLTMREKCPLAVGLLPTCFDTTWFHDWVLPYAEIHFIRGRMRFLDQHGQRSGTARQANFIAVYRTWEIAKTIQKPIVYHHRVFYANDEMKWASRGLLHL